MHANVSFGVNGLRGYQGRGAKPYINPISTDVVTKTGGGGSGSRPKKPDLAIDSTIEFSVFSPLTSHIQA